MADPSDLNRPYNSSVQVSSAWLNAVSDRLLNATKTDWRQWSDADLDTSPGSLADRFAKYSDQLRVTVNVGRVVSISPGYVGLSDGSTLEIGTVATSTPASLTMPDDTTLKVFVTPSGVAYGSAVPVGALYLADVTTAGGYVIGVVDKRSLVSLMASANGAIEDRLDTLESSVGSVESSIDFSAANEGDIIRVGSGGGLVADDATNATGLNADYLDGLPAALGDANPGDLISIGTDNSIIPLTGGLNADSLGGVGAEFVGVDPNETIVFSASGKLVAAGGLRAEYGSTATTYVYPDRRYAIAPVGSTSSVIFPKPSRIGEFVEVTNLGSANTLKLDFATFAAGTTTGNGLLGTMATEKFIAIGTTNTSDWFTFGEPNTTGSAATGAGGGGGGGGALAPVATTWSEAQSAWTATTPAGGSARTVAPMINSYSTGAFVWSIPLDASTLLALNTSWQLVKIPVGGGASTTVAALSTPPTGSIRHQSCLLPDGQVCIDYSIFNPANNTLTPIPTGTLPSLTTSSTPTFAGMWGWQNKILFVSWTSIFEYDRTTQVVTNVPVGDVGNQNVSNRQQFPNWTAWGADNKLWIINSSGTTIRVIKYNPASRIVEAPITVSTPTNFGFIGLTQSGRMLISSNDFLYSASSDLTSVFQLSANAYVYDSGQPLPDGRFLLYGVDRRVIVAADGLSAAVETVSSLPNQLYASPNGDYFIHTATTSPLTAARSTLNLGFLGTPASPLSILRSPFFCRPSVSSFNYRSA